MTPLVDMFGPSIVFLEVYLEPAEFDEGVFGVARRAPLGIFVCGGRRSHLSLRASGLVPAPRGAKPTITLVIVPRDKSLGAGARRIVPVANGLVSMPCLSRRVGARSRAALACSRKSPHTLPVRARWLSRREKAQEQVSYVRDGSAYR